MIVSGSRIVAAPRDALWAVLSDPARLAETLRGVLRSLLQRGLGSLFNEQVEAVLAAGALLSAASNER